MKKLLSIILIATAWGFISCSSNDDNDNIKEKIIEPAMFEGEWYSSDNSYYFVIKPTTIDGCIYENMSSIPNIYDNISGTWGYYKENSILRMSLYYNKELDWWRTDYIVEGVDDYSIRLKDPNLSYVITFNKVVDSHSMKIGQSYNISYTNPAFSSPTYSSSNSSIAKVDGNGCITALSSGWAFISIKSGSNVVMIKIDVEKRVDTYTEELLSTIDNILEIHGTPDLTTTTDDNEKVAVYTDSSTDTGLTYIHYIYDDTTKEISHILTIYNNENVYYSDVDYIVSKNYKIDGISPETYAPDANFLTTPYYYSFTINEDGYCVLYSKLSR